MPRSINDYLIDEVRSRKSPGEFNYGISTADRYVKTLEDCVGSDLCYRYAAKGNVSFDDALKASRSKLTFSDPGMKLQDIYTDFKAKDGVELPKNTLMVFKHVLTTATKDRDGDILRTKGAKVDPELLLLWQHVHTLPIGKMVTVASHTEKSLELVTAIVDLNELAHDAAVMIENKMGRFSHGFRAEEYEKMKAPDGKPTGRGFDVKSFEILEESLVSVPANPDAELQEVMISLIEDDKLTSSMMKGYGKRLRQDKTSTSVAVGSLDINLNLSVKDKDDEIGTKGGGEKGEGKEGCACGSSKEKDADTGTDEGKTDAKGTEVNCPDCGATLDDGKCQDCGYKKEAEESSTKELDDQVETALESIELDIDKAIEIILTQGTPDDFAKLINILMTVTSIDSMKQDTKEVRELLGSI